jgi:hypothetical protein
VRFKAIGCEIPPFCWDDVRLPKRRGASRFLQKQAWLLRKDREGLLKIITLTRLVRRSSAGATFSTPTRIGHIAIPGGSNHRFAYQD